MDTATIRTDVPDIELDIENARVGRYDRGRVLDLLRELEFRSLIPPCRRWKRILPARQLELCRRTPSTKQLREKAV